MRQCEEQENNLFSCSLPWDKEKQIISKKEPCVFYKIKKEEIYGGTVSAEIFSGPCEFKFYKGDTGNFQGLGNVEFSIKIKKVDRTFKVLILESIEYDIKIYITYHIFHIINVSVFIEEKMGECEWDNSSIICN